VTGWIAFVPPPPHKLLFAVSSFDQIYKAMHEAERRPLENRMAMA
jgi:hypothetical protein